MSQHSEDSYAYRKARRAFLAEHPVCWICGHGGANQIDHRNPDPADPLAVWRCGTGSRRMGRVLMDRLGVRSVGRTATRNVAPVERRHLLCG